jgi:hypothetical protein
MCLQDLEESKMQQRLSLFGLKSLKCAVASRAAAEVRRGEASIECLEEGPFQSGHLFIIYGPALAKRRNPSLKRSAAHKRTHTRVFEFGDALEIQIERIVKEPA